MNQTPLFFKILCSLFVVPYVALVFYFCFAYNSLLFSNDLLKDKLGFSSPKDQANFILLDKKKSDTNETSVLTKNQITSKSVSTYTREQWKLPSPFTSQTKKPWHLTDKDILLASGKKISAYDHESKNIWNFSYDNDTPVDSDEDEFFTPLSLSDKYIYANTTQGRVYKLDRMTGKPIWTMHLHQKLGSQVIFNKGFLFLIHENDRHSQLIKINSTNGEVIWRSKSLSLLSQSQIFISSKHQLIYGLTEDSIIAVDAKKGGLAWERATQGQLVALPLINNDRIYMANKEGISFALNSRSGKEVWNFPLDSAATRPLAFIPALGRLAVITDNNYSHIINVGNGKRIWRFKLKDVPQNTSYGATKTFPSTAQAWSLGWSSQNYILWAPCQKSRLCIKRVDTGQTLAHIDINGSIVSPPYFAGGSLFLVKKDPGSEDLFLTKYSSRKGTKRFQ